MEIIGSGGSSAKGGDSPAVGSREEPNNLISNAIARIVDLLGEGEIGGLVDGVRSIYLDDTPLENPDGTLNFKGVNFCLLTGKPDQDALPNIDAAEGASTVGIKVQKINPVVRTISDVNIDDLQITLSFPSLLEVNGSDGSITGRSVEFIVAIRCGMDWSDVADVTVTGKTNSTYERKVLIENIQSYGSGPWEVRITRVTDDAANSNIQDEFYWESYSGIIREKFTMPGVAAVGMTIDAQQFGSHIPTRAYEVYGLCRVAIPSNYEPRYGTYVGIWDGTFKYAWTCNPAWVLYDLCTNKTYGLGIDPRYIDKWSFYNVAKYCDELVPDGFGGQEQRFTFNGVLQTQEEAYSVVNAIASSMLCMPYWSSGLLTLVQDAPSDPSHLATPANVIDGVFNYSGTGLKSRHSVALVTFNDPIDNYLQGIEVVEFPDLIEKYGWVPLDVLAVGCTRRSQAHRIGRWLIESERSNETVTFTAGFDFSDCMPGSIIKIQDPAYAGVRNGGRIVSATTTQVTLDGEITLELGQSYTLSVVLPDGTVEEVAVTNTGSGTRTVLNTASLTAAPQANAMWVLSATNIVPRLFRVISNVETAPHQFEITAVLHDPGKYSRVYDNLTLKTFPDSKLPTGRIPKPTSVTARVYTYEEGANFSLGVMLSWKAIPDPRVSYYEVEYRRVGENWKSAGDTTTRSTDIQPLMSGNHEFRVRGRGIGIGEFETVSATVSFPEAYSPPPQPKNVRAIDPPVGKDWQIDVVWDSVIGQLHFPAARFLDYKIELCLENGTTVVKTLHTKTENLVVTSLSLRKYYSGYSARSIKIKLYARDIYFGESAPYVLSMQWPTLDLSAYNPVLGGGHDGVQVTLSGLPYNQDEVAYYEIYADENSNPTTLIAKVPPTEASYFIRMTIDKPKTIYVKVIPVDQEGVGVPSGVVSVLCDPATILTPLNAVWSSTDTYPRIEITETGIKGMSSATVTEFELDAVTGKAFIGSGDVILDANGIGLPLGNTGGDMGGPTVSPPNVIAWRGSSGVLTAEVATYTHLSSRLDIIMHTIVTSTGSSEYVTNSVGARSNAAHSATASLFGAYDAGATHLNAELKAVSDPAAIGTEDARVVRSIGDKFVCTLPAGTDVFKVISDGAHVLSGSLHTSAIRPLADGTTALQIQKVDGTVLATFDTTNARMGIGISPGYKLDVYESITDVTLGCALRVQQDYACTGNRASDNIFGIIAKKAGFNVPDGYTVGGYQIGLASHCYIDNNNFAGTISDMRAIWARTGIYQAAAAGARTVTNAYCVYVDNLAAVGTIVNNWGIYQTLYTAKNYFAGPIINGPTAISGNTVGAGGTLAMSTSTLPTATTADYAWLAEKDAAGAAGKGALHIRSENMGSADWAIVSGFVYKASTGDYGSPHEGLGCINTVDKSVKLYAGGAWRTLVTWT